MHLFELHEFHFIKNNAIPITLIVAPIISLIVIFCLKKIIAGGIINIGTVAMIVDAIPVAVNLIEYRDMDTLRNGPKNDPMVMLVMPFLLLKANSVCFTRPNRIIIALNPIIPVIIRIWIVHEYSIFTI